MLICCTTLDTVIASRIQRETILRQLLKPIKDEYDWILLDCPSQILEGYIDSDEPNINYVRLLKHTKIIHNTFKVSASTRLKAKRKAKLLNDKIFTGDNVTRMQYSHSDIERLKFHNSK